MALKAIRRALRREHYALAGRPELTWQRLHNRLQWTDPPLAGRLAAQRERRSRPGARPWIHRYTPLSESEVLVQTLTGHTRGVEGCAVSPDGTWIVSASYDNTLKIWDTATGTERTTLTGHTHGVESCAVSPDGTWILSASRDDTLKIWDAATHAERVTLTGHTHGVHSCAVSADGTWIVSAGADEMLKIWDVATGAERATLTGHTSVVSACAVSPDGTWIVSASTDKTIRVWDAATGTEQAVMVLPKNASAVALHPVAPIMGCGDEGGSVDLARLVGLGYGPLVVTAAGSGDQLTVRCPACRQAFPIDRYRQGTETNCLQPACGIRLRINQ